MNRATERGSLALVSPAPPDATGVADYSWAIAHRLAQLLAVDIVVADLSTGEHQSSTRVGLIDLAEFVERDAATPYTHVVYCLGNSPFHIYMLDMMERRPGALLAHESRFTDLLWGHAQSPDHGVDWYRRLLDTEYPDRSAASFEPGDGVEAAVRAGVFLFGPLIDRATRVLTTSEFTAGVARRERPQRSADIVCVGFGHPYLPRLPTPTQPLCIATIGRQNSTKGLDLLLEAFALVLVREPDTRLMVIGLIEEPLNGRIRDRTIELGIVHRVEFTGWLDEGDYQQSLDEVDIAVQLRTSTNGEVSAAVADCLGRGIPTVATAVGPLADYPDDVVAKVPLGATPFELAETLIELMGDSGRRAAMGVASLHYVREHDFDDAATALLEALS